MGPSEVDPLPGACSAAAEADVLLVGAHCAMIPCGKRVCGGTHACAMREFYTIWETSSHKIKKEYSEEKEKITRI